MQEAPSGAENAALVAEMGASPAVARRMAVAEVDSAALDSWDWDVFRHTHAQLVPHVVIMFMRLGLTQHEARSRAGRGAHPGSTPSACRTVTHRKDLGVIAEVLHRAGSDECLFEQVQRPER